MFPIAVLMLVVVAITPAIAFGQSGIPDQIVPCNGVDCTVCSIATLAQRVLNFGIYFAVFVAAVLFAWAGVIMLTNRANPGEVSRAKGIFWNVMVGLVGILAAWLLVDTIMYMFTGSHLWGQLC